MRIAFLTDWHVTERRLRGEQGHEALLNAAVHAVAETAPDLILIGGDLTGTTVPHKATLAERNVVSQAVSDLSEIAPVVGCRGNHDTPEDFAFLNHFGRGKPVLWCEEPELADFGDFGVMVFPWLDRGRFPASGAWADQVREAYRTAVHTCRSEIVHLRDKKRGVVVLGHVAWHGALLREGQPPVPTADPVLTPADLLDERLYEAGFFGHYHSFQRVSGSTVPLFYGGSLFVHEYGEPGPKGWMLYDTETKDARLVPIVQPMRVRLDVDPVAAVVTAILPAEALPASPGMPFDRLVEGLAAAVPVAHALQLRAEVPESQAIVARAALAALIEDLKVVVSGPVELDLTFRREEKLREGAAEVAEARTVVDKMIAWAAVLEDPPGEAALSTALEILARWEAEA